MSLRTRNKWFILRLAGVCFLAVVCVLPSHAQGDDNPRPTDIINPNIGVSSMVVSLSSAGSSVFVGVREASGIPLAQPPMVKLACPLAGLYLSRPAKDGGPMAQFVHVPAGDCSVEVSAPGYKPAKEHTEVLQSVTNRIQYVYVYLHPESEPATGTRPSVVPEKALREIDKGMAAMQNKHDADALKHLTKAAQLAPSSPDIAYLLGVLALNGKDLAAAGQHFQTAVNYAPAHDRALLELGYVQVETRQWNAAVQTLEKALQVNMASSRAHLLLANAYAQLRNYAKAQEHAQRAEEFGSENAAPARTLLAEILAAQGNREGAKSEFEGVLRDFPNAASASIAKEGLQNLANPIAQASADAALSSTAAPVLENDAALLPKISAATVSAWAPPSVDKSVPGVAADVACSAVDVVERTSKSTSRQLENLEKFLATEHIQHEEVNGRGEVTQIRDKNFSYMVFIEHAKDGLVFLDEKRDGGTGTDSFPTSLATVGLVSLGVDVFHPGFAKALNFRCEGLGQWRGKAAWILRFEQKPEMKSFLRLWQTKTKTVEVPLKGRVWVAASSYDVLHVESDLREPMKELELMRDHLAIDYGPVNFQNGKTELWLPWYADMYLELHGRRYHHNHTLTNFSLFAVDTSDKIALPKNVTPPEENPKQPPAPDKP
jgi:tetratricopeptide (TPR) repeat protein